MPSDGFETTGFKNAIKTGRAAKRVRSFLLESARAIDRSGLIALLLSSVGQSAARQERNGESAEDRPMGIVRKLRRVRRRLEGARLYAGLSGKGEALERVAQLERIGWRLERSLARKRCAA